MDENNINFVSPRFDCELPHHINMPKVMDQIESSFILQALRKTDGVKSHAAKMLGIKRTTLIEKMKKLNLDLDFKYTLGN